MLMRQWLNQLPPLSDASAPSTILPGNNHLPESLR